MHQSRAGEGQKVRRFMTALGRMSRPWPSTVYDHCYTGGRGLRTGNYRACCCAGGLCLQWLSSQTPRQLVTLVQSYRTVQSSVSVPCTLSSLVRLTEYHFCACNIYPTRRTTSSYLLLAVISSTRTLFEPRERKQISF